MNEWIAANIVQIIIAAIGFGTLLRGQRDLVIRIDKMERSAEEWREHVTELDHKFWSEKWPLVGQNTERIRALEEAVQAIRVDVHQIRTKLDGRIGQ